MRFTLKGEVARATIHLVPKVTPPRKSGETKKGWVASQEERGGKLLHDRQDIALLADVREA
jgi:hypothetical protein